MANNYGRWYIKSWNLINTDPRWNYQLSWPEALKSPFLASFKGRGNTQEWGEPGIQRPRFEPWLSSSCLWVLQPSQPPFLGWKSVLWGRKDSTVKGLDHSACFIIRGCWIQLILSEFGKEGRQNLLVPALHVSLWILLLHRHLSGQWEVKPCTSIIGCMTCAVTQEPQLIRSCR